MGTRRQFSREFKLEAVKLVTQRGVSVAQTARDLDVHENVLRKWVREASADPQHAFPGQGVMKPEQPRSSGSGRKLPSSRWSATSKKKPQPTSPGTRCEVRVRCEAPRGLVGGDVVRDDRCLAKRLLRVAGETTEPTQPGQRSHGRACSAKLCRQ